MFLYDLEKTARSDTASLPAAAAAGSAASGLRDANRYPSPSLPCNEPTAAAAPPCACRRVLLRLKLCRRRLREPWDVRDRRVVLQARCRDRVPRAAVGRD